MTHYYDDKLYKVICMTSCYRNLVIEFIENDAILRSSNDQNLNDLHCDIFKTV